MNLSDFKGGLWLHPLCRLFPRLEGIEFETLKADIIANGQREPITVHEGMVLDGGNRYRACIEAGIEPLHREFTGADPVAFVLSANLHRRHLTPGQQAAIVASAQDWTRAHGAGGDRKSDQTATLPLDSVADRAAQSGASERTQRMADKVARQSPELAKQVAHGEISLPKALEQLAPRPAARIEPPAKDPADVYERALKLVLAHLRVYPALLQCNLHISHDRSVSVLEELERAGIVAPMEESGDRLVLGLPKTALAPAAETTAAVESVPLDGPDELYDQAVAIVLKNRRASISLVQRHLRIGYNRAARLLEQMENSGVVSPMQSNGDRMIMVPADLTQDLDEEESEDAEPADATAAGESIADDGHQQLLDDYNAVKQERDALQAKVAELDAHIELLGRADLNAEVATTLAKRAADAEYKFEQLSGRNRQLQQTARDAQTTSKYQADLLGKIRLALGVESNAEILPTITARRAA
jgi:hypothetical protein